MERTNGAARAAQALTPPQQRGLLAIAAGDTHVRRDVVDKLRAFGLVEGVAPSKRRATDAGRLVADELRVALMRPSENVPARPIDIVEALVSVEHRAVPDGVPGAVARMLFDLPTDAARVAALRWLAGPDGAGYLGAIKDAFIVAARPGRTYEQTAEHLRISPRAVNRAVSRHNAARQSELDTAIPAGG
jgi:hypothetical protein